MTTLSFLGTGKMAAALISCISKSDINYKIIASSRTREKLSNLKKLSQKIKLANNNIEAVKNSDIIFICVKPQDIDIVLDEIKTCIDEKNIIVSIAAGIKISHIEKKIRKKFSQKIIRLMPNINCNAGEMACGVSFNKNIKNEDIKKIKKILLNAGKLFFIKEDLMDAVTAISGSGPAFFSYFIDLLADNAIKNGFDKKQATELAIQTAYGTSKMLKEKNIEPKELIKMVASPEGTTMAGLDVLYNSDIKEIMEKTINAAIKRSQEIGK